MQHFIENKTTKPNLEIDDKILIKKLLEQQELQTVFRAGTSQGSYGHLAIDYYMDWWSGIGQRLLKKTIVCSSDKVEILDHDFEINSTDQKSALEEGQNELKSRLSNPFSGYGYLSIKAERDLKKEGVSFTSLPNNVQPDGTSLTGRIVRCLKEQKGHSAGWKQLIELTLLDKINSVLSPDINFTRIDASIDDGDCWEIFLEEEHKGEIKLSDCGSGIKTIIFVMVMLYVVPKFREENKFIFSFEELENNLHPSLERKLLAHIRDYIENNPDNLLFITTHSNVAIDMFSNNENAQIYRAYNDGKASFIEKAENWNDHNNLLNDLGVRASDVLQSNCIVWLEGPSDRIYFNKWVELFNDGEKLEEGLHYQCVFYGGAILSHYSAEINPEDDNFIQMLRINRNAIVMMDSDKSKEADPLKGRVERILQEANNSDSTLTWVTDGREIENYLPNHILSKYFVKKVTIGKFNSFANKFKSLKDVDSFDKVKFASKISSLDSYTRSILEDHLNLKEKMDSVIEHIRKCNS